VRIWKKLLGLTLWLVGGAIALAVVAYLGLLAVNWRDRPPSEAALKWSAVNRDRPPVSDADNGFVYAMGFGVGRGDDPHTAGVRRVEWLGQFPDDPYVPVTDDPVDTLDYKSGRILAVTRLSEACRPDFRECAVAMEGADEAVGKWLQTEEWLLDRYLALLERAGWLEFAPFDVRAPLPTYDMIADGQKLLLSRAWVLAGQKDAAGARQLMEKDLRFWRQVLESSDILITKMIAVASLKRHFLMGSLVLRRLPSDLAGDARPQEWTKAFTRSELSLTRCLAGELVFSSRTIEQIKKHGAWTSVLWGEVEQKGQLDGLLAKAVSPMLQPQDLINQWAGVFDRILLELDVPLEEYPAALERANAIHSEGRGAAASLPKIYNPVGDMAFRIFAVSYVGYAPRVTDLEGIRRAADLTAGLRSRNVSADEVPAQLLSSGIRDPYTGKPFKWDAKEGAVVYTGLEPGERGRQAFKY
jgi:hypothetical protein